MNRLRSTYPESASRPYTFDRVVRILITVASIAAAVWLVDILRPVLLPFLVAWLIAYLLEPFVQYNRRLLGIRGRWPAIMMTLFECMLILVAIAIFILPSVINEIHRVAVIFNRYIETASATALLPGWLTDYISERIDFASIAGSLTRQDIESLLNAAGSVLSSGYDIVMAVVNWFLVLLYVVFIMADYERLLSGFRRIVPPKYRRTVFSVGRDVKTSMNHYFRGQALVALCVGILFCIGFLIIGMPMPIVMGLFIGVLNMVPYLQLISLVPTTLLCFVYSVDVGSSFWQLWCAAMLVYIVVQCIQDLIITPKIMGKAMGLNPALILLSLSVWGSLMGFIGLIIALPLTTLLLSYYEHYICNHGDGSTPAEQRERAQAIKEITESETK
ncbi:MAG: AI-2E family transporter [Muribaculaceae bacterium]|nr:AI-2E family transporter [Muribaculaceae bacterium]